MSRSLRRLVRSTQHLLPSGRTGITFLAYHLVGAGTSSPVDLPTGMFRRQIDELAATASVLSLGDAADRLRRGDLPDGPVAVLTFDDAYRNFADIAWPILAEHRLPATLFVPVGFLEGEAPAPIANTGHLPPVPWSAVTDMLAGGRLTVGSHGWNHLDTRGLDAAGESRELADSKSVLEERTEQQVESFCYPKGLWSHVAEARVARHYRLAVVGGGWRTIPNRFHPLRMQRISMRCDMPPTLAPVLEGQVCLEEWVADWVRRTLR